MPNVCSSWCERHLVIVVIQPSPGGSAPRGPAGGTKHPPLGVVGLGFERAVKRHLGTVVVHAIGAIKCGCGRGACRGGGAPVSLLPVPAAGASEYHRYNDSSESVPNTHRRPLFGLP